MKDLQRLAEEYLESEGFNLLDRRSGFVVADRPSPGRDRDTRLIWIPDPFKRDQDVPRVEARLLEDFQRTIPPYRDARPIILAHSLAGFSRDFRRRIFDEFRVRIVVPSLFFDAPFKFEEAPEVTSAIKTILEPTLFRRRV